MFTTTIPGALYVLMLAVAPHLQAPPPADPFVLPPGPPAPADERSAGRPSPRTDEPAPQASRDALG